MGLLTKLFGYEGTVRFEGVTTDGKKFAGKTKIETVGMTKKDIEDEIKNLIFVETGTHVKEVHIIAAT